MKKFFVVISFIFTAFLFIFTSPYVYADDGISREVKKYHYEEDDIYYSDGYFAHSSTEYDSHLATLSILMAKYSMNPGDPKSMSDDDWYSKQSNRVKGFYTLIGFDSFLPNEDYTIRTSFDTIGIACAKKKVGDYTVIGVTVRSGGYFLEWANNVWLGDGTKSDYMHEGWYNAAKKLRAHVERYISDNSIKGKIKLWMAGYSRGGAVTNIAAGLYDNDINNNSFNIKNVSITHDDLYAYTFEAPMGANINSKTVKEPTNEIYNNIFNVVNPNDLVTKVAMKQYGFTRFGTDKFITTKLYDPTNFDNNRNTFKKMYSESYTDVDKYSADNFQMYGITGEKIAGVIAGASVGSIGGAALTGYLIEKLSGFITVDKTKANYDANIALEILIGELVNAIGSRQNYCNVYQTLAKDLLLGLMSDDKTDKKLQLCNLIINILLETMARKFGILGTKLLKLAYPGHSETSLANIEALVVVACKAFAERPNEVISVIKYISDIFKNHETNINVAHLECQDDYYIDAYNNKHTDNKINKVSLNDNATLAHISFFGYNDVQVYDSANNKLVDVEGHVFGKSDVKKCDGKYSVGYYSYTTEEKMELYFPIRESLKISFKSYSKKLRHLVTYNTSVQYLTARNSSINLPNGSDHVWFNSDRVDLSINVNP